MDTVCNTALDNLIIIIIVIITNGFFGSTLVVGSTDCDDSP